LSESLKSLKLEVLYLHIMWL